jgi:Tfp pilus assembly protein PilO
LALERKIEFIEGLLAQRQTAAQMMNDLSAALPDRVWLTEVNFDSGAVRIKGSAPSNSLLADYVSRLQGSSILTEVTIESSAQKRVGSREYEEFALQARVKRPAEEKANRPGPPSDSNAIAALTKRLQDLEAVIPARAESAELLRDLQRAAADSGMRITKFVPGNEVSRESYIELPMAIEATGSRQSLGRFFQRLADSPRLWLITKFSFRAVAAQDPGSPVRASLTARTYLAR